MSWRDEILLDQQFFGPPDAGLTQLQQKIVTYVAGTIGGVLTTLNFIHYLRLEIENNKGQIQKELLNFRKNGTGDEQPKE
jgi:hypothetical protein